MATKPKDKPRKQKLKVFRTPIGFHDAFVAAPSRKAALEAWGAEANIFAQGIAEEVTDPKLMEEPLARPGEVIRRLRGSAEEHAKALGNSPSPRSRSARVARSRDGERGKKENRPSPRRSPAKREREKPSRDELDAAEEALEKAGKKQRKALARIDDQIRKLERERRELQRKQERERDALAEEVERARSAYRRAMQAWEP